MNKKMSTLKKGLSEYVSRMKEIRQLSSPGIEEIGSAQEYSRILHENFSRIGVLAGKNREFIDAVLNPFLNSTELLDDETIEMIVDTVYELMCIQECESIDASLVKLLVDRLNKDAGYKDDADYRISMLDKQIETNYLLVNITMRVTSDSRIADVFRENGFRAAEEILAYLDKDKFITLSPESREMILVDSRYESALCENITKNEALIFRHISILERALEILKDSFYREQVPDFDWKYHEFRIYDYLSLTHASKCALSVRKKIAAYTEKCMEIWKTDPEYYKDFCSYTELESRRLKNHFEAGEISREEYTDDLYRIISGRNPYDYSVTGYECNVTYPAAYIHHLAYDSMSEEEMKRVDELYRSIIDYAFRMPKMGMLSPSLEAYTRLLYGFRELPGCITFEDMGLRMLAAFHPPTCVHSRMVARISRCLATHLMRLRPELFNGICGYEQDAPITEEQQKEIIEYTYHSALCHDFGKLMIIDTIFIYGRKLMDFEFDLIKSHPQSGAEFLADHASTAAYADVARGHHLWYDCSRGYPAQFNTFASPVKTIIDIVAVADCMDAATDGVGRSYNRGKTLEEYTEEVREGAGTRYAPWAPELLDDSLVKKEIGVLIGIGRTRVYRETYKLLRMVRQEGIKGN